MIQRLLLNRIDTEPAAPPVGGQHHSIPYPLADETKPALAFIQLAKPRTKAALDAAVREHHPPASGVIRLPQLRDHCCPLSPTKSKLARRTEDSKRRNRR